MRARRAAHLARASRSAVGPCGSPARAGQIGRVERSYRTLRRHRDSKLAATRRAPCFPQFSDIAFGLGSLWIVNRAANRVVEVDPLTTQERQGITVGQAPAAIAVGVDSLWVANFEDDTVTRIADPRARADGHADDIPGRRRPGRRRRRRGRRLGREPARPHGDAPRSGVRRGRQRRFASATSRSASRPARGRSG